ncbi:MAG: hypothetical protein ACREFX_12185 [Opitutaceae bacterium]
MKIALLLLFLPILAAAQTAPPGRSPFLPPDNPAGTGPEGPSEPYELAGASVSDQGEQVCVYDRVHRESRWLKVGGDSNGLQVVSYNPADDEAVVKFDGRIHVLALRKAPTATSAAPMVAMSAPPPIAPRPGRTMVDPSTIGKSRAVIKQERDARMLVSDLLEIGIQQRKAYEAARKRAAEEAR